MSWLQPLQATNLFPCAILNDLLFILFIHLCSEPKRLRLDCLHSITGNCCSELPNRLSLMRN
ncbi:hypothetical protein DAI22_04g270400 [Oryza sativa Japonica Group]|nr:hypothetical protein DAI22_04g270400 [Oryza sativa Japonica Group]